MSDTAQNQGTRIHAGFVQGESPELSDNLIAGQMEEARVKRIRQFRILQAVIIVLAFLVMAGFILHSRRLDQKYRTCVDTHCHTNDLPPSFTVAECKTVCKYHTYYEGN
jgi:hypothetical protein